jgi:hypothetical protein
MKVIKILQYNVWKSCKVMAPLLADPRVKEIDVIAVQEPYQQKEMFATHCPRSCDFWPAYPEKEHARACFLVNKRIPSHSWSAEFIAENLAVLTIQSEDRKLNITNIYSPPPLSYNHVDSNSPIHQLHKALD